MTALRYLLDTNICFYIRQKRPAKFLTRFEELRPGEVGISVITYGELSYGVAKSADPERAAAGLSRLAEILPVLPLPNDEQIAMARSVPRSGRRAT